MRFARGSLGVRMGFVWGSFGVRIGVRTEVSSFRMNGLRGFGGGISIDVEGAEGGGAFLGDAVALVFEEGAMAGRPAVIEQIEGRTGLAFGGCGAGASSGGGAVPVGREIGIRCVAHDFSPATKVAGGIGVLGGGVSEVVDFMREEKFEMALTGSWGGGEAGLEGDRAVWTVRAGGRRFGVGVVQKNQRVSGIGAGGVKGLAAVRWPAAVGRMRRSA
jgi:hypothetical protein